MDTKRRNRPCVKYFIFGFNVIMVVIGFAIAALGVWLKTDDRFRTFLSEGYRRSVPNATWDAPTLYAFAFVLIALGCVMIVVAFFGCCGAILENYCLLIAYFVCLMLLLMATLGCGIYLFMKRDSIQNEIGDAMDYMVQHYYQGQGVIQKAMDALQQAFRCCGSTGCGDFREFRLDVPRSCDISCDGCRDRIYRALRVGYTIATVIFVIVLIAELLGVALSMYLVCWLCQHRTEALYYYGPQSKILREDPPQAGYPTLSRKTVSPSPVRELNDYQQPSRNQQLYHQKVQQVPPDHQYTTKQARVDSSPQQQRMRGTDNGRLNPGGYRTGEYSVTRQPPPPRPPPPYYEGRSPPYQEKQWRFS